MEKKQQPEMVQVDEDEWVPISRFHVLPETVGEDTRTDEQILKELGIPEDPLLIDVDKDSVEDISDRIASRVMGRLLAKGWSPDMPDDEEEEEGGKKGKSDPER